MDIRWQWNYPLCCVCCCWTTGIAMVTTKDCKKQKFCFWFNPVDVHNPGVILVGLIIGVLFAVRHKCRIPMIILWTAPCSGTQLLIASHTTAKQPFFLYFVSFNKTHTLDPSCRNYRLEFSFDRAPIKLKGTNNSSACDFDWQLRTWEWTTRRNLSVVSSWAIGAVCCSLSKNIITLFAL